MPRVPLSAAALPWPDLVFHVLAHVPARFPSSAYDPGYVHFAARHLGPAARRELGRDARHLTQAATDHDTLARVQLLAVLFDDMERAARSASTPLEKLGPNDVDRAELLAPLREAATLCELLRCAVELERVDHARLPPVRVATAALQAALDAALPASPSLEGYRVRTVRALGHRGRLFGGMIWVGAPDGGTVGPTPEHAAWQAAHESTVGEVHHAGRRTQTPLSEREVEHVAVVLLSERSRRAGLGQAHRRWYARMDDDGPPNADGLPGQAKPLLEGLLASGP